jgi:multiple sugar transport system permease protein
MTSGTLAWLTVLMVDTWQWTPFMMLLLLAGLQSLPEEVMEAAELDTRSAWQAFWTIVFPMLLPWSVTAVLIRAVEMLKIMDIIVVLTNGGPGIATESVTLTAYRTGVTNFDLGYASAMAFALLVVAVLGTTVLLRVVRGGMRSAG